MLKNDLASINVTMNKTTFATQSNVFNITDSDLFPDEIRVYILNMYPLHARRIMCKVRERETHTCGIVILPHLCRKLPYIM